MTNADLLARMADAHRRIQAASQDFENINRAMPEGGQFQLPAHIDVLATVNAVSAALVDSGLLDAEDLAVRKLECFATALEQATDMARQARRQMTGLIIPGART
jgi:hypothetical protein